MMYLLNYTCLPIPAAFVWYTSAKNKYGNVALNPNVGYVIRKSASMNPNVPYIDNTLDKNDTEEDEDNDGVFS